MTQGRCLSRRVSASHDLASVSHSVRSVATSVLRTPPSVSRNARRSSAESRVRPHIIARRHTYPWPASRSTSSRNSAWLRWAARSRPAKSGGGAGSRRKPKSRRSRTAAITVGSVAGAEEASARSVSAPRRPLRERRDGRGWIFKGMGGGKGGKRGLAEGRCRWQDAAALMAGDRRRRERVCVLGRVGAGRYSPGGGPVAGDLHGAPQEPPLDSAQAFHGRGQPPVQAGNRKSSRGGDSLAMLAPMPAETDALRRAGHTRRVDRRWRRPAVAASGLTAPRRPPSAFPSGAAACPLRASWRLLPGAEGAVSPAGPPDPPASPRALPSGGGDRRSRRQSAERSRGWHGPGDRVRRRPGLPASGQLMPEIPDLLFQLPQLFPGASSRLRRAERARDCRPRSGISRCQPGAGARGKRQDYPSGMLSALALGSALINTQPLENIPNFCTGLDPPLSIP
jgi:hypothetical protein